MKIIYPKLPVEFKKRWLEKLRSGEIVQGKLYLCNPDNEMCCLGVACLVAEIPTEKIRCKPYIPSQMQSNELPTMLKGTTDNPVVKKLSAMNDGYRMKRQQTFKQIANWIERNL